MCVRARIAELQRGRNDAAVLLVIAPGRGFAFNRMIMVHPYHVHRHGSSSVSFIFTIRMGKGSAMLSARDFFVKNRPFNLLSFIRDYSDFIIEYS